MPHGAVHSLVGNDYDEFGQLVDTGWMGSFFTAGLDPLFWLHHANIDRLWEVWLRLDDSARRTRPATRRSSTRRSPSRPRRVATFTWSIGDVLDTEFLDYVYESLDAPSALPPPAPEPDRNGSAHPGGGSHATAGAGSHC